MELEKDKNNEQLQSKERGTNAEILRRLAELQKNAETIRTSHALEMEEDSLGSHLDHLDDEDRAERDLSYDGVEDETDLSFDDSVEEKYSHPDPSHENVNTTKKEIKQKAPQAPSVESILLKHGVLPCSLQMFYAMAVTKKEEDNRKAKPTTPKPPAQDPDSSVNNRQDHDIQLSQSNESKTLTPKAGRGKRLHHNFKVTTTELDHDLLELKHDESSYIQMQTSQDSSALSRPSSVRSFKRFFSGLGGALSSKSSEDERTDSFQKQNGSPFYHSSGNPLSRSLVTFKPTPIEHEFLKWDASDVDSNNAWLLYTIFRRFCYPPPTFESVRDILKNEKHRLEQQQQMNKNNVNLSQDVAINVGDSAKEKLPKPYSEPVNTSGPISSAAKILDGVLLELPVSFQLAYLRILIRLLANENDDVYDTECYMDYSFGSISKLGNDSDKESNSDGNGDYDGSVRGKLTDTDGRTIVCDTFENDVTETSSFRDDTKAHIFRPRKNYETRPRLDRSETSRLTDLHEMKNNQLYSVVRFRCGEKEKSNVDSVLISIERLLEDYLSGEISSAELMILGPLCRLLGLLCMAGITVRQLQQIISMIKRFPQTGLEEVVVKSSKDDALPPISFFTALRLSLLRALILSTEGASPAKKLLGKASPRYFFCFGISDGMTKRLSRSKIGSNATPFKASFGMACWFRAESFRNVECASQNMNSSNKPVLLSVRTDDSAGIEISFKVLPSEETECAANIVITVFDSEGSTKTSHSSTPTIVELSSCPIFPKVWYHLAIRHVRKGYLSLAKDELTIFLDGKALLNEPLKFPKLSSTSHENVSSRSTNGVNRFRENKGEMTIKFWSGLNGATGALYLFNDSISDATVRALLEVTSGVAPENEQSRSSGFTSIIDKKLGSPRQTSFQEGVALKTADAKEIIIGTSQDSTQGNHSRALSGVVDLVGDDELVGESGLSQAGFSSKLFLAWDPMRMCGGSVVLEAHNNANVRVDGTNIIPWTIHGSKDVIGSMGGIRCLLPLFRIILNVDVENSSCQECFESSLFLPMIFLLLSAFFRDNEEICREWLRCGGFDILEQFISNHKTRCIENEMLHGGIQETLQMTCAFRQSLCNAELMVDSLSALQDACSFYFPMEVKLSYRLALNVEMWFGGLCSSPGIFLFKLLLPLMISLCRKDPKRMLLYIGIGDFIRLIRECTDIDSGVHVSTNIY